MNFKKKINLAVMAHVDAGKTTVTEQFLYHSGAKKMLGKVDQGTTTTDSLTLEKERGITIRSSTVSFDWRDCKINLIDTPGHMDFIAEVERTFSVLDGAVLVISAKEGIQPQTRVIFERLKKMNLPTILFVNKIDRMGVNLEEIRTLLELELSKNVIYMQETYEDEDYDLNIKDVELTNEFLVSQLLCYSEAVYQAYFEHPKEIEESLCHTELYQAVQETRVYPVYFGSGLKDIGMEQLLDGIVQWLTPKEDFLENLPRGLTGKEFQSRLTEDLSAYAYKVEWVAKNYRKVYIRVFAGGLWFKQRVPLYHSDTILTVNQFLALEQGKEVKTDFILAGDLCVIYDNGALKCGQWLGKPTSRCGLTHELKPLLSVQVRPHEPEKRMEVLNALYELDIEDPYLQVKNDETEITLRLFGRLQQDIIRELLLERYQLLLDFDEIQTVKKEIPKTTVVASIWMGETYDDETKALLRDLFNRYAAGIELQLEPLPSGSGIQYENQVSFGDLEKPFQNAVQEGIMKGLMDGLGHEVVDTKVTFLNMMYSSVMSTPADYRFLAALVVKRALHMAGVHIIEPYMNYVARVPLGFERYITAKLMELNAVIMESEFTATEAIYSGEVKLDNVKDYALDIKMYTEGKGSLELEFLEYR